METRIIKTITPKDKLGHFSPGPDTSSPLSSLSKWTVPASTAADPALSLAARHLRETDVPVAFPTETVYGLGADATRSAAVKGIYAAKGRPSDNPLIVHVCDLDMLRGLLRPTSNGSNGSSSHPPQNGEEEEQDDDDPIPAIYRPLLARFWPGPLTILLPNPPESRLAKEVTAGLPTFGARMPASPLARSLIALAGAPLAAPSANASTRPSPTTARHVADDLEGKIEVILDDGGACGVGVESTVVDGLCCPPVVLRPGGVGMDELRGVEGWEGVEKGYRDGAEGGGGGKAPRAPGMKYKHYSPRAKVVLYEAGRRGRGVDWEDLKGVWENKREAWKDGDGVVGVVRTGRWHVAGGLPWEKREIGPSARVEEEEQQTFEIQEGETTAYVEGGMLIRVTVLDLDLGKDIKGIAQGLFSALRELDRRGAEIIFVEGVDDGEDIAAAVMNRLRKAATITRE